MLEAWKNHVEEFRLVPASGGVFELTRLDSNETVFSKATEDRFPEEGEILRRLGAPASGS